MAPSPRYDKTEYLSPLHEIYPRDHDHKNWAHANPGVVLVFCMIFIVGVGIVALFLYRYWLKRKAVQAAYEAAGE